MEYIHSTQGMKDMKEYEEEMSVPSFSLEIDDPIIDICKEINEEHGNGGAQADANNIATPAPEKKGRKNKEGSQAWTCFSITLCTKRNRSECKILGTG